MVFRSAGWRGLVAGTALLCLGRWFLSSQGSMAVNAEQEKPLGVSELYNRSCARCHGKDGKGKEAREVTPNIPDFTSHKWQTERSDAQLLASIQDGKGKEMPSFAEKINREQARELVAYVRHFDAEKSRPQCPPKDEQASRVRGAALGSMSDFEKRFQELRKEMESLQKQFRELQSRPPKP
jgi:mono/diheme cytochrome c family protein